MVWAGSKHLIFKIPNFPEARDPCSLPAQVTPVAVYENISDNPPIWTALCKHHDGRQSILVCGEEDIDDTLIVLPSPDQLEDISVCHVLPRYDMGARLVNRAR